MKKTVVSLLALAGVFCSLPVFAQQDIGSLGVIGSHFAAGNTHFTQGAVAKTDLDRIVTAAIRAPSAANRQPWHFTVVQTQSLVKQIVSQANDGNIIILVSASGDGASGVRETLDCALATQSIYLAAQALGYGSRIYTGPIDAINKNMKTALGLSASYRVVAAVRIGKIISGVDAVSAASSRKDADTLVTYK
jgi:nitroreductase